MMRWIGAERPAVRWIGEAPQTLGVVFGGGPCFSDPSYARCAADCNYQVFSEDPNENEQLRAQCVNQRCLGYIGSCLLTQAEDLSGKCGLNLSQAQDAQAEVDKIGDIVEQAEKDNCPRCALEQTDRLAELISLLRRILTEVLPKRAEEANDILTDGGAAFPEVVARVSEVFACIDETAGVANAALGSASRIQKTATDVTCRTGYVVDDVTGECKPGEVRCERTGWTDFQNGVNSILIDNGYQAVPVTDNIDGRTCGAASLASGFPGLDEDSLWNLSEAVNVCKKCGIAGVRPPLALRCPSGQEWNTYLKKCVPVAVTCEAGYEPVLLVEKFQCRAPCPAGQIRDAKTGACIDRCPPGSTWDGAKCSGVPEIKPKVTEAGVVRKSPWGMLLLGGAVIAASYFALRGGVGS